MYTLDSKKLDILADTVRSLGFLAKSKQAHVHRNYKADGSVLTEMDLEISTLIQDKVNQLFPECTFISEEFPSVVKPESPYTFILDPIDGTDVFSQGLPAFAVALGILDSNRKPVGAYISAPRFGKAKDELFIRLDPGKELFIDDEKYAPSRVKNKVKQVTMGSNGQLLLDFTNFKGKVRTFGSSIIHLVSPVVFDNIDGCVNQPCFVWDVAAAHAVLLYAGMDIEYADGKPFVYTDEFLYEKKMFRTQIYAGTEDGIKDLRENLPLKK